MPNARVRLDVEQGGGSHAARLAHPTEVITHQVDDHHVLRRVLRRATQRGGVVVARRARQRALDRCTEHVPAAPLEEQLGAQADDVHRAGEIRAEARIERCGGHGEQLSAAAGELGDESRADVHLIELARADELDGTLDRSQVIVGRPAAELARLPRRTARWITAEQRLPFSEALGQCGVALGRPQRLEPPTSVHLAKQIVVERELGRAVEGEPTEPPTADHIVDTGIGD